TATRSHSSLSSAPGASSSFTSPRSTPCCIASSSAAGSRAAGSRSRGSAAAATTGSPPRAGKCLPLSAAVGGNSSERWSVSPWWSMPDWKQYVREHLPPLGLGGAREAEIREELAQQLEDAHTEALALGATEEEAAARAAAQIRDWHALARELREAEQPVAERVAERRDQYSLPAGTRQGMGTPEGRARGLRMRFAAFMSNLWQDARYGARMLRKNAGLTAVILLTLALGIGANTAIFSVVNAVVLQPLPYKDSAELVQVWEKNPKKGFPQFSVSPANFMDWKEQSHSLAQMAAIQGGDYTLTGAGEPSPLHGVDVSTNPCSLLETQVQLGRDFLPGEDKPGAAPVVIISNELWQGRLGGDRNVLGKTLTLDSKPHTIVGVM